MAYKMAFGNERIVIQNIPKHAPSSADGDEQEERKEEEESNDNDGDVFQETRPCHRIASATKSRSSNQRVSSSRNRPPAEDGQQGSTSNKHQLSHRDAHEL